MVERALAAVLQLDPGTRNAVQLQAMLIAQRNRCLNDLVQDVASGIAFLLKALRHQHKRNAQRHMLGPRVSRTPRKGVEKPAGFKNLGGTRNARASELHRTQTGGSRQPHMKRLHHAAEIAPQPTRHAGGIESACAVCSWFSPHNLAIPTAAPMLPKVAVG